MTDGSPYPKSTPTDQTPADPTMRDALGFDSPKKDEKYNTVFLTQSLVHERRRTQMFFAAAIIACVLGIALWMWMPSGAPPAMQPTDGQAMGDDPGDPAPEQGAKPVENAQPAGAAQPTGDTQAAANPQEAQEAQPAVAEDKPTDEE